MRIAVFPSAFHPSLGGVEELSKYLAHGLRQKGHLTKVFTERWPRTLPENEVFEGIDVCRFPFRVPTGFIKPKLSYLLTHLQIRKKLLVKLREFCPDVLHVQCISSSSHYALYCAAKLRVPLVASLQGELSMDAAGIYQKPGFSQNLMRRVLSQASYITACSSNTLKEAEQFYMKQTGEPLRRRAKVVNNGVSIESIQLIAAHQQSTPYIFALGRHVKEKGFDVLIKAMRTVLESHVLLLGGDGPIRTALEQLALDSGLNSRIRFLGRLSQEQAHSYMKGASVFVLPSQHEPFGIVNLEAMASNVPIVATRVGGVPEILEHGRDALLVSADDPDALGMAINAVILNAHDAIVRARHAADKVTAYGWSGVIDQYLQTYSAVLDH